MSDTVKAYLKHQLSFSGRLRYIQAQRNMEDLHDLSRPLTILDAAGGNGINTEFLAGLGHNVTLLDYEQGMIDEAKERLGKEGLLDKCRFKLGRLEELDQVFTDERFDLILCHHVIEYLKDPAAVFSSFNRLSNPGGQLSLITINPASEVIRAIIFKQDPAGAKEKLSNLYYDAKWFGDSTLYTLDQQKSQLDQGGWEAKDFRAIRVFADYIPEKGLTSEKEDDIISLELSVADAEPYRNIGRYIQFCCVKKRESS